jgi:predicted exporter
MALLILRCVFMLIATGFGAQYALNLAREGAPSSTPYQVFFAIVALAGAVVALDLMLRRKRLDTITSVYFGLIIGLFLTYILRTAFGPTLDPEW